MGKIKELTTAFDKVQRDLLKHKYLYYVKSAPIISDYAYDMMEKESRELAKQLGFRADQWEGPADNEKDHVHWMVDFDDKHELAESVIAEVENGKK